MLESIIHNATNIRVDGVAAPFLTPRGNIAGQFYSDRTIYDFELENNFVLYQQSYRKDTATNKGKKCPGGYWIPRDKDCKKGVMTPSASGKSGFLKKALGAAIVGGVAYKGMQMMKRKPPEPTPPPTQAVKPRRRISPGAVAAAGLGVAGAAGGGVVLHRRRSEDKVIEYNKKKYGKDIDRTEARGQIDDLKTEIKKAKGQVKDKWKKEQERVERLRNRFNEENNDPNAGRDERYNERQKQKQLNAHRGQVKNAYKQEMRELKRVARNRYRKYGI